MTILPADVVAFWGGPFSNFEPSPMELPCPFTGVQRSYATVEHYFQASKAASLADHEHVASQPTPKAAKKKGRCIKLRADWEDVKYDVMVTGLRAKFHIPRFRRLLLDTGDRVIVEDSPYDFEWGIRDADGGLGGRNLMGKALMEVRAGIASGVVEGDQLSLEIGQ